jgi:recombinational DNA repair protein RecR
VSFYLAELIVLQVLKDEKDAYELYLITNVCNLYHVLRILSANDGDMSDENKQTLRKRVIAEWDYEKKLSQQYKVQTEFLDGYLKKVFK